MDNKTKIALCKACTLATVIKDCKSCSFNIGLKTQENREVKMDNHYKLVNALTQWDIKQSKKKGHNKFFLGIALKSLHEIENEMPNASVEDIAKEAFEGRLLDFILKSLIQS